MRLESLEHRPAPLTIFWLPRESPHIKEALHRLRSERVASTSRLHDSLRVETGEVHSEA